MLLTYKLLPVEPPAVELPPVELPAEPLPIEPPIAPPPVDPPVVTPPAAALTLVVRMDSHHITNAATGAIVQTMDVLPVNLEGRIMLPLRFIGDALGADITWDGVAQTVDISHNSANHRIVVGELAPGMDVPAQIIDGRTMVPLRFLGELLGAEVSWDGTAGAVTIVVD